MKDFFKENLPTHFIFPIDGDYLNDRDVEASDDSFVLCAEIASATGSKLTVNGIAATEIDGIYKANVHITPGKNILTVTNETDGTSDSISVFFSQKTVGKYRISSDDNILFLADINANKDIYTSIFDNPYLAVYKKAHDMYGAKIHLNIFYSFDRAAAKYFSEERADFDLSMMTDKFKSEWKANADWLKLSFHAKSEMPDKPYLNASPEEITADFLAVRREILRFAGEESFSGDVTTVHWGEVNPACVKALRDLGHRALTGYFTLSQKNTPCVSYYVPTPLVKHIGKRDFWHDSEMNITFGCIDRVTNVSTFENVMKDLYNVLNNPQRSGFVSIMIHEQYFYKDYRNYLPDFEARVLEPARLLFENGYKGTFIKEIL